MTNLPWLWGHRRTGSMTNLPWLWGNRSDAAMTAAARLVTSSATGDVILASWPRCQSSPAWKKKTTEWNQWSLLLLLDRRYTESPVCKINVAVFSSSSLLPYSFVWSWTAAGHTLIYSCCLQKRASLPRLQWSLIPWSTNVKRWSLNLLVSKM